MRQSCFLSALCLISALKCVAAQASASEPVLTVSVKDQLQVAPPGSVTLEGRLGERIGQCIHNRIMVQSTEKLLDLYRTRALDVGGYKGEFIGKWLAGAALGCRYQSNPALNEKMQATVAELIKTATSNGYISTYKPDAEFHVWDIWNQKYVLLGLIAQYDQTGNEAALGAAARSASHVLDLNGPGKLSIEEYGPAIHKGGVNFSILEPIVLLYERTGEKKYLDFARYIVDAWSRPGKYTPQGVRLIENAEAGAPLVASEVLHSYVHMSCFEGLAELYRATGERKYLDATIQFANCVREQELMIHGSVSNHEMWYGSALHQTEMLEKPSETCATATWMKLCYQLLRLTGESKWADEMEISLYNALLGAMMPQGEWWCYDQPLAGERVPSRQQATDVNLSCCVSSGPRGLLITPQWAVMANQTQEPVINLYSSGTASFKLASGKLAKITQETDYPVSGRVTLKIETEEARPFGVSLRIPLWSKQTVLKANGEVAACAPGSYARIERIWKAEDRITLELDFRGRVIRAPGGAPQQTIMRGPILLAFDSRLVSPRDLTVWLISHPELDLTAWERPDYKEPVLPKYNFPPAGQDSYISLKPVQTNVPDVWMAFEVPFVVRPAHFQAHRLQKLVMCDFASAGNQWSADNVYRVWLPQPMLLSELYPRNTWKIMHPGYKTRPSVPEHLKPASRPQ